MKDAKPSTNGQRLSRPARLTLAFLLAAALVGLAATQSLLLQDQSPFDFLRPTLLFVGGLIAAGTMGNLLIRWFRWQYLLRHLGISIQTVPSLGAFAGSFAFLPVPVYVGQLLARVRLTTGVPPEKRGTLILVFLWGRALDVWAVGVLSLPALPSEIAPLVALVLAAMALPAAQRAMVDGLLALSTYAAQLILDDPVRADRTTLEQKLTGRKVVTPVAASLTAWALTASSLLPLAWALGIETPVFQGVGAAAASIAVGALSLIPLGVGVSGAFLLAQLESMQVDSVAARELVFVFRAATLWVTVAIGVVALVLHQLRSRRPTHHDHFDDIDHSYDVWLPPHFREHVLLKKTSRMVSRLAGRGERIKGLDVGCGRGWYLEEMQSHGMDMAGVDLSWRQLEAARRYLDRVPPLAQGSILGLPFRANHFDFAYTINVLHHMPSRAHQVRALAEIARVVRPGGLVFIHEMNVINPLFRFYLGYVFPIMKGIEEGTEPYMDARDLASMKIPGLVLSGIDYFSFAPDFVPASVLPAVAAAERRLEQTSLAQHSAHFLAAFEKVEEPPIE